MGVAVSGWHLASTVSKLGQLGVVSGTALALLLIRNLQLGDSSGRIRFAIQQFPVPRIAEQILTKYYIPGGKQPNEPFRLSPLVNMNPSQETVDLIVLANFVEVFLAKEGHAGVIGINFLEKIQLPTLPSIYGAMLAGVDFILMGAVVTFG